MTNLFNSHEFFSHSGLKLSFKIECDALTDKDWNTLALMVASKIRYGSVIGIPKGGTKFAEALSEFSDPESNIRLLVDDVLTTGKSMTKAYNTLPNVDGVKTFGIVAFSRMPSSAVPNWIKPIFQLGEF